MTRFHLTLTDEFYSRPKKLKVFVCSQMKDGLLANERKAAIDLLSSLPWAEAWAWEKDAISGGPYSAPRTCIHHAATSDCLVLIVADTLTRVTKQEYEAARGKGAAAFIFQRQGSSPDATLQRFLDRELKRSTVAYFGNVREFRSQLSDSLTTYIVGAVRHRNLDRWAGTNRQELS